MSKHSPSPVAERDLTAAAPGPLHGNAWVAKMLRDVFGGDEQSRFDVLTLREVTDLRTVGRRAMQAAEMLRHTALADRPIGAEWLTSMVTVFRSRAILAADEAEFAAQQARAAGMTYPLSTFAFRLWVLAACTNAWVEAHLMDAAAILAVPDANHDDASAWMRTAADRLEFLDTAINPRPL
ncbi:hypothetical protein [Streptomyces sp. H39-C1]|uniref:hypothetical protein n=1 Tax=Streptomyces sp. H39-C1 TaxID=3004355 RepID=UPI0022AFB502|nr:hypothetical protein [Streptomyces sp. H39-C1]MCZ4098102.1 hypothetical protein [Streptomyces sp. H39-C1]